MEEPLNWQAIKDYRSDTAGEVASLASFKRDLEFTMAAAQAILARAKDSSQPETGAPENTLIVTSLWNSALVSYARCFASGVRARLDVSEFKLWPGIVADAETAHSYFINQRNKYIAHSVNRFEESRVALMVSHSQRGVIGGGPFLLWPSAESEEN